MIISMHFSSLSGIVLEVNPLDWRETECDMRLGSVRAGESHYKCIETKVALSSRANTFVSTTLHSVCRKYFEKLWIKIQRKQRNHIQFGMNSNQ